MRWLLLATSEVANGSGASLRQLQWWDECGIVSPRQRAGKRAYSLDEALEAAVTSSFRAKGVPLSRIRRILTAVRAEMDSVFDSWATGEEALVLSSEEADWLAIGEFAAVTALARSDGPVLAVSASDGVAKLVRHCPSLAAQTHRIAHKPVTRERTWAAPAARSEAS